MRYEKPISLRELRYLTAKEAMHYSMVWRWLRNIWRQKLTTTGRSCVWLMLFFGFNSAVGLSIPMYIVWSFFVVVLVTTRFAIVLSMPKVRLTRTAIPSVSAGEMVFYEIEIENTSRRILYQVEIVEWYLPLHIELPKHWEPEYIEQLNPGEKKRIKMQLLCRKRGAYILPQMAAMSGFPFGIWRKIYRQTQETPFLVYPEYGAMESFEVPHSRQYQPGGILLSSQVGDSAEFMHTREYREGDNPRHIHWASWARQNQPIIKVYQEEYFVRMALLVDSECFYGDYRKHPENLETALSITAAIADVLSRRDYIIDLFAAGEAIHHFQAGRALAHLEHILDVLACVEPVDTIDWERLMAALVSQAPQFSAMVLVFLDWNVARQTLVQRLRALGLATRVIVVRKQAPSLPLPLGDRSYVQVKPNKDWQTAMKSLL